MIWDCILCNCILLNWWLCNIVKSIGYVFEQRYEKYVFYDITFMFGMFIIAFVKCFIPRKILKAYYGFRVLYVFPFPSAGHWPLVSGRDKILMRDTNLGWVFSWIGSPSALGVRRDERERVLNSIVNTQFRDDLSVEATEDPITRFYYKQVFQSWFLNLKA